MTVPAVLAGVVGLIGACLSRQGSVGSARLVAMVSTLAAACVWFPLELLFYDALGFDGNLVLAGRCGLILTTFAPILAPRSQLGETS